MVFQSAPCRAVLLSKNQSKDDIKGYQKMTTVIPQGADPLPPSSTCSEEDRNHLNEEFTPLLPTGIGERV
jgi:hypothetical protein